MLEEQRSYRKKIASHGLIYLGGEERDISVRNLSITGLLAELADNSASFDIRDVFQLIKLSTSIDIYLPEMRLAGEAEVVRADIVDGLIHLALEFRNLSYDVDTLLYKRKAYRKNMTAPGQIVFNNKKYDFFTKNISVDGLMILMKETIDVDEGTLTIFDFKRLNLRGKIKVIWVDHGLDGSTLIGLQYVQMEKDKIKGIPRFNFDFKDI
ncbi:MAG: PilZ domain-containing protein [Methylococcaceae bacterium]